MVIDGKWIDARLTGKRGEKAALARAMGVTSDQFSKILKGERAVQPVEILPVLRFFKATLGDGDLEPLVRLVQENLPFLNETDQRLVQDLVVSLAEKNRGVREQPPKQGSTGEP